MLNLGHQGNNKFAVLTVHEPSKLFIENDQVFQKYCKENNVNIEFTFVPFDKITAMYGSLHCASQVIERENAFDFKFETKEVPLEKFDYFVYLPTFYD